MSYRDKEKLEGESLAKFVLEKLNVLGGETNVIEGFAQELGRSHRTLQQAFGRLVLACIKDAAKLHEEARYDLRNQAWVESCVTMKKALEDTFLPLI